jgi:hypothetical protein
MIFGSTLMWICAAEANKDLKASEISFSIINKGTTTNSF